MQLIEGDCLDILPTLKDKSIDLILTDPPYGTTACKWDSVIPFEPMWKELKRIIKDNRAKKQPLKITELIHVFSKNSHNYYPIMVKGNMRNKKSYGSKEESVTGKIQVGEDNFNDLYYPKNIIEISNASQKGKQHPTQKPIALLEYLVKTYTNEDDTVLDFTMGSGSTGVACKHLNRKFIGIEKDKKYFKIAKERINCSDNIYQQNLF